MEILLDINDNKGTVYVGNLNEPDAAMTFYHDEDGNMVVDHTEVSDKLRGQGAGRQLLDTIVAHARSENRKIIPVCPFVKSVFKKDNSIADVLK